MTRRSNRWQVVESVFPTVVRYLGVLIMAYAALIDRGRNPALIPAATGMIFFKSVFRDGERD